MRDVEGSTWPVKDGCLSDALIAKMNAKRRNADPAPAKQPVKLPARLYGIMTATALVTFATLTSGYELLFSSHQFA